MTFNKICKNIIKNNKRIFNEKWMTNNVNETYIISQLPYRWFRMLRNFILRYKNWYCESDLININGYLEDYYLENTHYNDKKFFIDEANNYIYYK